MASTFTHASPYLQQTAKQLASRGVKSWTYPLWAYVVGCVGVAVICLLNGYVSSLIEKRETSREAEHDLEAGVLARLPTDGTCPDSMAKGSHMNEYASVLETERKVSLPAKMKRVFQKFAKAKANQDDASATATTTRNRVGSQARGDWKCDSKGAEVIKAKEVQQDGTTVSRPERCLSGDHDAITRADGKIVEEKVEGVDRK